MNWLNLNRGKILVYGKKSKFAFKGIQEEHTAFLHSILSNDILNLKSNTFNYNFMLNEKGHVLYDFFVFKDEDKYILDFEVNEDTLLEKLSKIKMSYQVYFEKLKLNHIFIFGEDVKDFINTIFGNVPEKFTFTKNENVYIANNPLRIGEEGFDIFTTDISFYDKLDKTKEIDTSELDRVRIKNCVPKIGKELIENVIPLETNIWKYAISLNKGCYVGQEAIARVYYRGKPPRVLVKLSYEGNIKDGDKIVFNNKNIGFITSTNDLDKVALGLILKAYAKEKNIFSKDNIILKIDKVCEDLNV